MADWSDRDIKTVKTMWRKGATATKIAETLGEGFTRGAVLGKIHRLGLKKAEEARPKAGARAAAKVASATKSAKSGAASVRSAATHAAPAKAQPKLAPARAPIQAKPRIVASTPEPAGPMPIWALGQCQCRWPIGNLLDPPGLFCAAVTADGSSWCSVHEQMVYTGSARPRPDSAREQPRFAGGGRSRF
jgi:GcrA cell cycle regulator